MDRKSSTKPSIFIIAQDTTTIFNFRISLIRELTSRGWSVSVLAPHMEVTQRNKIEALGAIVIEAPISRVGINPIRDIYACYFFWRYFKKNKPDVTLSYAAKTNIWATIAGAWASVPLRVAMVEGLGYAFTDDGTNKINLKKRLLRHLLTLLYRMALPFAQKIVVLNPDDQEDIAKIAHISSEKVFMLGAIGVSLEDWKFVPAHLEPITFTFVGRMLREKGVNEFLQAAQNLKGNYPNIRFLLLGGTDVNPGAISEKELLFWVEQKVVEWPGQVEPRSWLEKTSVFVLPSYYREGVPRSTQEAMAMGRPVITTDVPGCRDTVEDQVNGFLIPPHDPISLQKAMTKFILRPELISLMGSNSRRIAESKFDEIEANNRLLKVMGIK